MLFGIQYVTGFKYLILLLFFYPHISRVSCIYVVFFYFLALGRGEKKILKTLWQKFNGRQRRKKEFDSREKRPPIKFFFAPPARELNKKYKHPCKQGWLRPFGFNFLSNSLEIFLRRRKGDL